LDPGLGHFVSGDPKYSFEILARLDEVAALGSPVLVSPSRKSFLAGRELLKASGRLPGTIAASAIAVLHGAGYIRTHDVEPVRRACEIAEAVRQTGF
ncbi:MAG: dihydropteroate synthase, partial [Candidatus Peribacteraceae bacterium]|nr:dihydropteroate synthase [Candidatus Peribacteraceae bacterium]